MNDLADLILRDGKSNNKEDDPNSTLAARLSHTYYRQFLPSSDDIKYNLVVSSRTFLEVGDLNSRIRNVDILWRKVSPGGFLVIVEAGNKYSYSVILSLRDYLLEICKIEREKYGRLSPIHVFSPCPHDQFCPRYNHKSNTSCHFSVKYQPLFTSEIIEEKYSYIVLQKQERKVDEGEDELPRVVQPVLKKSNHSISRVCTPEGTIRELVTTKSKHGSKCYALCKNTNWGDFLPVILHPSLNKETNESDIDVDEPQVFPLKQ